MYNGYLFHGVLDTSLGEMVFLGHADKGKKLQAIIFLALGDKPIPFLLMSRTFHGIKRQTILNLMLSYAIIKIQVRFYERI